MCVCVCIHGCLSHFKHKHSVLGNNYRVVTLTDIAVYHFWERFVADDADDDTV